MLCGVAWHGAAWRVRGRAGKRRGRPGSYDDDDGVCTPSSSPSSYTGRMCSAALDDDDDDDDDDGAGPTRSCLVCVCACMCIRTVGGSVGASVGVAVGTSVGVGDEYDEDDEDDDDDELLAYSVGILCWRTMVEVWCRGTVLGCVDMCVDMCVVDMPTHVWTCASWGTHMPVLPQSGNRPCTCVYIYGHVCR